MFVRYRSYTHDDNEVALSISSTPLYGDTGYRYGLHKVWRLSGVLQADTQAELTGKIRQLEQAYSVDGGDLTFRLADGTVTAHSLLNKHTMGGVRVTSGPTFSRGEGAEYSTFRSYEITLEADVLAAGRQILSWQEEVRATGSGGPMTKYIPVLRGPWVRQITSETSLVTLVQSGSAVGLQSYPVPPGPLFPIHEEISRRIYSERTPRLRGGTLWEFPINWSYTMEAPVPFFAHPHVIR